MNQTQTNLPIRMIDTEARVSSSPETKTSKAGKPYTTLSLYISNKNKATGAYDYLNLSAMIPENMVREVMEADLVKGDTVRVRGDFSFSIYNGRTQITIWTKDFKVIDRGGMRAPTQTKSAAPSPGYAPSYTPDDDDVPF